MFGETSLSSKALGMFRSTFGGFTIFMTYRGGAERAGHAHKKLQQVIIAISGSFDLHLDDGFRQETITLRRAHIGVLLDSMVWRVINNFSSGAVCLCLASLPYEEADYYRKYTDFRANIGAHS